MELDRSILLNHPGISKEVKDTYRAIWEGIDRAREREIFRNKIAKNVEIKYVEE